MPGIGDTLRSERRRQGRTLADAAAETRVRESYLAALESDDFDVLGGDVYARGFIRLYAKYLSLDVEALVEEFRRSHERPEEITAIPGATIDEVMSMPGGARQVLTQPVLAAMAVVGVLVVLFLLFRAGSEERSAEVDPNAPGPSPAAVAAPLDPPATTADSSAAVNPAPSTAVVPPVAPSGTGEILSDINVVVTAVEAIQLTVLQGQPPVSGATLQPGDARTLVDDGQQVVFTVSNFSGASITVNGGSLISSDFVGQAVQITCTIGQVDCDARAL
ncbi:MAG: helix-turn-helix domain-containing protein [Euzebya sp.]